MSISINSLKVEFSAKCLFDNISYIINRKDKIALVGKNGAGKSTMLKIIAGIQKPTSGSVSVPRDTTIGYLPQHMTLNDTSTVIEEVRTAFSHIREMHESLDRMTAELSERTDYESREYQELIEAMTAMSDRIAMEESDNCEAEMEKTLLGLGFTRDDFNRPTAEFSGGWRMRIELAKLLLTRPDVLLLDEPTNHLDIESIQWLENFLITKANAVVLVSHDRAFIDNVTNRTIEISCGKAYDYRVNYSKFVELRKERVEQQQRAYENQQKQIAEIKDFIERFRYKPTKSNQVQSRVKQLEKIVPIEVDEVDNSALRLKFPPAPRSGDFPLILDGVGKTYGSHNVFSGATFTMRRGEKVAFVGKNGEGKSTLVKCIMGEIPFDGSLKIGHNVSIGYFAQNQAQLLDESITVFDTIDRVATGDMRTKVRDILGAFMFGGEAADKKVKVLSGGEKTRLAMIRLLLEPMNLLILDEPTNHLDMKTKDILKEAVKAFEGTVIVVSHDRQFLDGLVDKVYEFGGGKVREHLGGIYDFLNTKRIASLSELEKTFVSKTPASSANAKKSASSDVQPENTDANKSIGKFSYTEQKERQKMLKKAQKEVKDAETRIAGYEEKIQQLEARLSAGDSSADLLEEYAATQKALENEMSVWELAQMHLDEINN